MKLEESAQRILAHLQRFEADPTIDARAASYYCVNAYVAGSRIGVTYVSFQGRSCLTKAEALAYLAWLDAGHVGRHYEALKEARP